MQTPKFKTNNEKHPNLEGVSAGTTYIATLAEYVMEEPLNDASKFPFPMPGFAQVFLLIHRTLSRPCVTPMNTQSAGRTPQSRARTEFDFSN
jgi:hypothetical protein